MKRKLTIFTVLMVLLTTVIFSGSAFADGDFWIEDNELVLYTGSGGAVTIPNSVTSIGECAFADCTGVTSITIPDSVKSIGDWAFMGCTGLKSITLPNGLTSIGTGVFEDCTGLTSITLPNSVTSIGSWAFSGCNGLKSISIPNSVTIIDALAFEECSGLTSITIPNSVTSIGNAAFMYCTGLTSITLSNSVTSIKESTFGGCTALKSIIIPNSVTSIGDSAFTQCSGFTSITIPNSVTSFGTYVFAGCDKLQAIVGEGSYAQTYCENKGIPYRLSDTKDAPAVKSAAFGGNATVGKAVSITVTTPTTAKYIAMCSSNGSAYKTWTSGYTDSNGVRTWKVNYTFSGSGSRTMYFKASADNKTWSSLVSATVTVNKSSEAAKINSVKFDSSATVGKAVDITVTTPTSVKYIAMCNSAGSPFKTWTSGYTDSGSTRTWKVTYSFAEAGNRTMYFKASADNSTWSSLVSTTVTVSKAAEAAKINSVKFDSSATVGKAVGITVTTPTSVKYIAMCSSNGSAYKTWTSGYTDSNGVRTWKVNYTFSGAGNRTMYFRASADNSTWSSLVSANVTVNKAAAEAKVTSASFSTDAVVGQSVAIVVKTTTSAKYVRMCSENGSTVKTWTSGYSDSGDVRTWKFTYSFSGSGYRSLTFKASADNSKYDAGIVAKVAVNPAVPVVSSASFNASSAKVSQSVGITVKTSSNATTLAMCSENGSVVKTWSASGNSTVSGNVRTWNVSYAFGGAGTRSIGFKANAGSGYGITVTAKITITK